MLRFFPPFRDRFFWVFFLPPPFPARLFSGKPCAPLPIPSRRQCAAKAGRRPAKPPGPSTQPTNTKTQPAPARAQHQHKTNTSTQPTQPGRRSLFSQTEGRRIRTGDCRLAIRAANQLGWPAPLSRAIISGWGFSAGRPKTGPKAGRPPKGVADFWPFSQKIKFDIFSSLF